MFFSVYHFEAVDQIDAYLLDVVVAPLIHHRIDDREFHPIADDNEGKNVRIAVLPVSPIYLNIEGTLDRN